MIQNIKNIKKSVDKQRKYDILITVIITDYELRGSNMRYSSQRDTVLKVVKAARDHPTADTIYSRVRAELPKISLGTVYRNLNSLVDAGRVRRVSIPGKADRFDHTLCWHSHMYCTVCGGVVDADVDEKQVMKLVKNQKGVVQDCAVVLFGVCEECLKKQAAQ